MHKNSRGEDVNLCLKFIVYAYKGTGDLVPSTYLPRTLTNSRDVESMDELFGWNHPEVSLLKSHY